MLYFLQLKEKLSTGGERSPCPSVAWLISTSQKQLENLFLFGGQLQLLEGSDSCNMKLCATQGPSFRAKKQQR